MVFMINLLVFLGVGAVSLHAVNVVSLTGDNKQCSRAGDMKKWLARRELFSCEHPKTSVVEGGKPGAIPA
jgi:hypothetical protein